MYTYMYIHACDMYTLKVYGWMDEWTDGWMDGWMDVKKL